MTIRRRALFFLLWLGVVMGGSVAWPQEVACDQKYADPEAYWEHLRDNAIFLGHGFTIRPEFGCGKAEIGVNVATPLSEEQWEAERAWLLEQLASTHPLGKLVQRNIQSSMLLLNGMFYVVDQYENGYLQYRLDYPRDEENRSSPSIAWLLIYYPHEVSGIVSESTAPHPAREVATQGSGEHLVELERRFFSAELEKGEWYFVSYEEFSKLKVGEKATFIAFGPISQPVL